MCVKIFTKNVEKHYDTNKPLEEQLEGCKKIVVKYEPKDKSIPVFMKELERFAKHGIDAALNIQVIHNDNVSGAKTSKAVKKLKNDISVNELIKTFVLAHKEADKKLEELLNHCAGINCNVK